MLNARLACVSLPRDRSCTSAPPRAITRGCKHGVSECDRGGAIGRTVCGTAVFPKDLAILRPHTNRAAAGELHVLPHAPYLHENRGGITRAIAPLPLRFPDHVARLLIERHQSGIAAAGRADQAVAVDQDRFTDSPLDVVSAEFIENVFAPLQLAFGCRQARQVAVGTQRVNEITVDRGNGAWPVALPFAKG